jgi:hypothetical protein
MEPGEQCAGASMSWPPDSRRTRRRTMTSYEEAYELVKRAEPDYGELLAKQR